MKLYEYLFERYGMTKETFSKKPDWAKEELRKEHSDYLRTVQLREAEERRWNNLTDQEKENEDCYNNLVGAGIPMGFINQLF